MISKLIERLNEFTKSMGNAVALFALVLFVIVALNAWHLAHSSIGAYEGGVTGYTIVEYAYPYPKTAFIQLLVGHLWLPASVLVFSVVLKIIERYWINNV